MSYSEKTSKVTFRIFSTIFIIYENVLNDKYCFDVCILSDHFDKLGVLVLQKIPFSDVTNKPSKSPLCYKIIVDFTIIFEF